MLACAGACCAPVLADNSAGLEVVAMQAGSSERLRFTLRNTGSAAVDINLLALPWAPSAQLDLQLVRRAGDCAALQEWTTLDPQPLVPTYVALRPGDSQSGLVDLNQRWPDLRDARERCAYAVRWTLVLPTRGAAATHTFGGTIDLR